MRASKPDNHPSQFFLSPLSTADYKFVAEKLSIITRHPTMMGITKQSKNAPCEPFGAFLDVILVVFAILSNG